MEAAKKATVMLVDDDPAALSYITTLLRKEGYEVLVGDSGYSAFSLLEKRHAELQHVDVDCIIVDWKMPGWDGLKLRVELMNTPYRDVPYVLMSGAVTREELEAAARRGLSGLLVKPVDRDALVQKINEIIANQSAS